ncbi:MAG: IS4 family transposase, partial [Betaproteobacteria bacterium]
LYTCLQILSVSVFEKTEISCALQADAAQIDIPSSANQLNLFNF